MIEIRVREGCTCNTLFPRNLIPLEPGSTRIKLSKLVMRDIRWVDKSSLLGDLFRALVVLENKRITGLGRRQVSHTVTVL